MFFKHAGSRPHVLALRTSKTDQKNKCECLKHVRRNFGPFLEAKSSELVFKKWLLIWTCMYGQTSMVPRKFRKPNLLMFLFVFSFNCFFFQKPTKFVSQILTYIVPRLTFGRRRLSPKSARTMRPSDVTRKFRVAMSRWTTYIVTPLSHTSTSSRERESERYTNALQHGTKSSVCLAI